MQCLCFPCSLHRAKDIDVQVKKFVEAVYYASQIQEHNYQLRLLESLGYKAGSLTDEGIEGEMAAIECDRDAYLYLISEIEIELDKKYKRLVHRICYKKGIK